MAEKIKSLDFIKKMLNLLDEKKKLKIIKYNKKIQNKINITIFNYRAFSKRYIIYDSYGGGREYDGFNNHLIYSGEFKNGERNGKGREYNVIFKEPLLLYEGEVKSGKRNGTRKEYDRDNKLIFGGEYLNGEKNGKIKVYDNHNEKIIFEGEYLNGKRIGKFKENYDNIKIVIENGKCKEFYENNNLKFEGDFKDWKRNGKGKEYYLDGQLKIDCEFFDNKKNGACKEYYPNGKLKFEGEYLDD